jgi:hypothetical protein
VARYLSPEWVASFDDALRGLDLTEALAAAGEGSLAASDGAFSVAQVVTGVPGGDNGNSSAGSGASGSNSESVVRTVFSVSEGTARLVLDPDEEVPATATIVLRYDAALAMARGELDPADALAAGRVRVRGDLAALVAGQALLAAAAQQLGTSLDALTDGD